MSKMRKAPKVNRLENHRAAAVNGETIYYLSPYHGHAKQIEKYFKGMEVPS